MAYWWVNQGQTYFEEFTGGFLWAPKQDRHGNPKWHWSTMTQVAVGDIIFSHHDGFIKAVGWVVSKARETGKPTVGKSWDQWGESGWEINVNYTELDYPISPKKHIEILLPHLFEKYNPLRADGKANQIYLARISDTMGQTILDLAGSVDLSQPIIDLDQLDYDPEVEKIKLDTHIENTEKASLVLSRIGQGTFRNRVKIIEKSCRVTGVKAEKLLIASHIKPWSESDNFERLNGNNGLFLSPHVDKLFDKGFISFEKTGEMLVSEKLDLEVLEKWSINPLANYGRFNSDQAFFLEFHQLQKFKA